MEKKKKEVSASSTKSEILEAYRELSERIKEQKPVDRQAEKKREDEARMVKDASQLSSERIIKGLADIKLEIGKSMDTLEEKLLAQYKNLSELQQALDIEKRELEEVHEIKVNADSLAALLAAQKEKKADFEAEMEQKRNDFESEMSEKRLQWKKEQESFELAKKDREAQLKKERSREEEEYSYNLQLKRKKERDAYEAGKAALEKELADKKAVVEKELADKKATMEKDLAERESVIKTKEKELTELRAQVDAFPRQLEKAVKDTEKAVMEGLEIKYKHEAELAARVIEGERKLHEQTAASLEAKIKDLEEQIRQSTQRANEAGKQVQNIALKAIEGASTQRVVAMNYEKKAAEASKE
ncbi:MAG: hypothetical protein ACMUIA_08550 [bacterium]